MKPILDVKICMKTSYGLMAFVFVVLCALTGISAASSAGNSVALKIVEGTIDLQATGDLVEPFQEGTLHWRAVSVPGCTLPRSGKRDRVCETLQRE